MKKLAKRILVVTIILLIAALLLSGFYHIRSKKQLKSYERVFSDTLSFFENNLKKLNDSVYQQKQVIISLENAVKLGLIDNNKIKNENWKLITHNIKLEEQIVIFQDSVSYTNEPDIITISDDTLNRQYMRVPLNFKEDNEFYSISGTVIPRCVLFDKISIYSYPEITIGWKKEGLFKKQEPVVTYYNRNPYSTLKSMDAITIEPRKPRWYESKVFWFLAGFGSAYTLDAVVNK